MPVEQWAQSTKHHNDPTQSKGKQSDSGTSDIGVAEASGSVVVVAPAWAVARGGAGERF